MSYIIIAGDYKCSITAGGFFSLSEREKEHGERMVSMSYNNNTVVAYSGPAYINDDKTCPVTKNMIDKILRTSESSPDIGSAKDFLKIFSNEENAHIVIGQTFVQNHPDNRDSTMGKNPGAVLIAISGQKHTIMQFPDDFPICFAISDELDELKEFQSHSSTYQNGEPTSQYIDSVQWGLHKNVEVDYGNRLTDIVRFIPGCSASVLRIKGQNTEKDEIVRGDLQ